MSGGGDAVWAQTFFAENTGRPLQGTMSAGGGAKKSDKKIN
jgi:hypothetical protein